MNDPYVYENTNVLINLANIKNQFKFKYVKIYQRIVNNSLIFVTLK